MTITAVIIILSVLSVSLTVCFLDARYNLKLVAWMNGEVTNPFMQASFSEKVSAKKREDTEMAALKARIAALEAIVTEPAYELNQKLNRL